MSAATQHVGFVEVKGSIEPGALAGEFARNAHNRVGEILTLICDWLEGDGNGLNQTQKVEFNAVALRCMDGFYREVLDELVEVCDRIKVGGAS
jgi:hypothetical protein